MNLFYHQIGRGPAIILIHGLFGMADNLMSLARELSEQYTVYSIDLRNHGRSDQAKSMSYSEMATDVIQFMDANGLRQAFVLGHSLGGKVAMQMALQSPSHIKGLIVLDIAPVSYPSYHERIIEGLKAVEASACQTRTEAQQILSDYVDDLSVLGFLMKSWDRDKQGETGHWRFNLSSIDTNYYRLQEGLESSACFDGESLFIKGEHSPYITRAHEADIRALFPDFQFKMVQNTGHWLHVDKPKVVTRIVKDFLERAGSIA